MPLDATGTFAGSVSRLARRLGRRRILWPAALLAGLFATTAPGCSGESDPATSGSGAATASSGTTSASSGSGGAGGGSSTDTSTTSSGMGGAPVYADNFVERAHVLDKQGNELGWGSPPMEFLDVFAHGSHLYGCAAVAGPGALSLDTFRLSGGDSMPAGTRCDRLVVDDQHLVVSSRGGNEYAPQGMLVVYDVATDPADPKSVSFLPLQTSPEGMAFVTSSILAVAMRENGVELFQISAQGTLSSLAKVPALVDAWDVALAGSKLYVADATGLGVIDITTPQTPLFEGIMASSASLKRLDLGSDGVLYAAAAADGVQAWSLADPSNPALLSTFDTSGAAFDVAESDGHLFVADWNDVRVLDVSDPAAMTQIAVETLPAIGDGEFSRAMSIDAVGSRAYPGEWSMLYDYELLDGNQGPDVDVEVVSLGFPTTAPNGESALSLIVRNEGDAPLEITNVVGDATFVPMTTTLTIPPGVKDFVEVRFRPTTSAAAAGHIVLSTNDPDEATVTLPVAGNTPGLGVGDALPAWSWVDLQTGQQLSTTALQGSVLLLSYFATF